MTSSLPSSDLERAPRFVCYRLDPIADPRWARLVENHPRASVFHSVAWLEALRRTYGYEPLVFTTSPPTSELKNAMLFCRINSWLTGRRLVSLPFSDHCEPLCDSAEDVNFLIRYLQASLDHQEWKYLEIRPVNWNLGQTGERIGCLPASRYFLHVLDLRPDLNDVFHNLDKDSVQRRIRRAERAGLVEKCGRSEDLLKHFYALFVKTRSRHRVPPVPYSWFQNLIQCQCKALEIRVAYQNETPIAAILTLQFRETVYYKYGCSDTQFNKCGAMPWLLWNAIAAAKSNGATEFDLGRTQEEHKGLLVFKNHWVPRPKRLIYWQFPFISSLDTADGWKLRLAQYVFSFMPERLLTIIGRLIYRHIG
jgi:Acetyltransferase (GNAT) domain